MTTTENQPEAPVAPTTVSISVDMLRDRAKNIADIDTQIAQASGNDAAVRKAIIDEIMTANKEQLDGTINGLLSQLKEQLQGDLLVGFVARMQEALTGELKELTDATVDEKVKAQATESVNVDALKTNRKAELDAFRALKTILDGLGLDTSGVEEPKRSGGGRSGAGGGGGSAKTGMNKEGYRYIWNGKGRPPSQNSFSSFAFYVTKGLAGNDAHPVYKEGTTELDKDNAKMSAAELRAWLDAKLAEQGKKFGAASEGGADDWEFELPNGSKIAARRLDPALDEKDNFIFTAPEETPEAEAEAPAA